MKKRDFIGVLLGLILILGVMPGYANSTYSSSALADSDHYTFELNDLTVSVPTSQVPFYKFWETNDNSTIYLVHFETMFEILDLNNNSQYDQFIDPVVSKSITPLAQMTWEMGDVEETEMGIDFNLSGYVSGLNPNVVSNLMIEFRNHITTVDDNTELKFDVAISNYSWNSQDAMLVLGFKLEICDSNYLSEPQEIKNSLQTRANFGNAYLESVSYANTGTQSQVQQQIQSRMTIGDGSAFNNSDTEPRAFITYEHFTGDLIHDPTIGIDQSQENTFTADNLSVKVPTNQLPFYFFWRTDLDDPTYRVAFDTMFEVEDTNSNGVFDDTEELIANSVTPLALLNWQMSEIINTSSDGITYHHFNLTGFPGSSPQVGEVFVQFRNHIKVDGNNSEVKFDIVISNYEWKEPADTTLLVLGYKLTTTDEQYTGIPEQNGSRAIFGDAYMETIQTAFSNTGDQTHQVTAALSIGSGSKIDSEDTASRIYIAYSYFEGNLTHDPTIGLLSTSEDANLDNGESSDEEIIPILFASILVTMITIPVVIRKFKMRKE